MVVEAAEGAPQTLCPGVYLMDAAKYPSPASPGYPTDVSCLVRRLEQTERLLACFRRAAGHDLPNQLVGLQGLLHVLELEEADRLSADGRAYLQRLVAAARRAHE